MRIHIIGIEKPFELKIEAEAGAKFSFLKGKKVKILYGNKLDIAYHTKYSLNSNEWHKICKINVELVIPKGFKTDLATIPQIFWGIFPPIGAKHAQYATPAALHDYLYYKRIFDRKTCDQILLQAMKQKGCNLFVRYLFYCGIRIFGSKYYN